MRVRIFAVGNLGGDAEVKEVNGSTVVEFSVAVSNGKDVDATWYRCSYWSKFGAERAQHLKKGIAVSIVGSLVVRPYTNQAGYAGTSLDVRVDDVTPHKWNDDVFNQDPRGEQVGPGQGPDLGSQLRGESAPAPTSPVSDDDIPF